jgi:hypothetical protein
MADTYLAYPGIPVTIKGERFQGEDDYYAPYNLKFSPGEAHILNVYTSLDEVPDDVKNELFNYLGAEKYQEYIADLSLVRGAKFYFDLKRGLSDIWMVPDVDLEGTPEYKAKADLKEEVEKYLAEKQKRKEFVDLGTRASGTSKEKAAWRKVIFFTVSDLEALEKNKGLLDLIKKDRVFPKIVPDTEKDNGVSSGAAFMKTKLREYYPAKPVVDTTEGRKVFIEAANRLSDAIADVVNLADFDKNIANNQEILFDAILNAMPGVDAEELKDTLKSLSTDYKEVKKIENEVDESYYEVIKILKEKYGDAGNPSYWNFNPDILQPEELDAVNKIKQVRAAAEDDRKDYSRTSWVLANPKYSILSVLKEKMPKENFYFHEYSDTIRRCINHFFDKRFLTFFYKEDKYKTAYESAERMGGFTQEDFDRKYQPTIDSYKNQIQNIEEENLKLTIEKPYEQIKEILNTNFPAFWEQQFAYDIYSNIPKKIKILHKGHYFISGSTILGLDPAIFPKWMDAAQRYFELWIESNIKKKDELQKKIDELIADNPIRETEGDDWSWAGKTPEEKEQKKKARESNTAIELTYIKRTGGYNTSMVDNAETAKEFILNIFGFGGFTGGTTLTDVDAQNHIRYFAGAMSDLGDILNLDIKYLNQRGNLLYALGSYGGQRTLAFFRGSPEENLISFTKTRGDGTVCHEYGHYLDFLMGGFTRKLSSSFDYRLNSYTGKNYLSRPSYYSENSVTGAMYNLMKFIVEGYGVDVEQKVNLIVPEQYKDFSTSPDLKRIFSQAADVDVAISMLQDRYRQYKRYSSLKPRDMAIYYTILSHYGHKEYEVPFNISGTQFYAASKGLDATRSKPYWGTPVELFARAFETYVFDKLEKAGRVNNYLVSGWFSEFPDNVYPSGQEREALFGYFEKLIEALKREYSVPDFVATWTTERTDDYTDFEDNQEVSVDADTGEVVNKKTDKENIAKMFRQLTRMLKKS